MSFKLKKIKKLPRSGLLLGLMTLIILTPLAFYLSRHPLGAQANSLLKLDEGQGDTIHDSAGAATGTLTDATWKPEADCFNGQCLFFNGAAWVSFGDESTYDFTAATSFTLQFWFRHGPASAVEVIVQKYEGTGADGGYRLLMNADGTLAFGVDDANGGFADDTITSSQSYDDNRWHHLSAVKNGTTGIYLYVDANLVASDTDLGSTGTLVNNDSFFLGDSNGIDDGDEYVGYLDELKVYTTSARSADQIKTDLNQTTPNRGASASFGLNQSHLSEGLVGHWQMDESSANTCPTSGDDSCDSSGNVKDGAWNGNATSATGKFGSGVTLDGTGDYVEVEDINL